jgi:hypothetical protein
VSLRPICRLVAIRLAGVDDVDELGQRLSDHVGICLRCQAEAARYRTLQRRLGALADRPHQAPEGLVASVLDRLPDPVEMLSPRRRRPILPSRATVTAAATGAAVVATAGTLAVLLRRLHPPI